MKELWKVNLNSNIVDNFETFKEVFSIYFVATKTDIESKADQLDYFINTYNR